MKILVIGTIDNKGGAAQISWEIRKRLKADGHSVHTFVRYKYSNEPDVHVIPRKRYQDWLVKLFANDLTFAHTKYIFRTKEYLEADIIHCHNLHSNFFNLKDLIKISREKSVIWTIHDLWAITGFANDSITLRNPNKKRFLLCLWDNTPYLLSAKNKIYRKSKLHIVAVSHWLKDLIKNSILRNQNITPIYNGIDTTIFKPFDKQQARTELKLPLDKKIIGFPLKGWIDSSKLMDLYKDDSQVLFVSIGHSNSQTVNKNIHALGRINEPNLMAKYLAALDVFFYPTEGDTFGLTAAEALAVGTPVVTYKTDALPEIVKDDETGKTVTPKDIMASKNAIDSILKLSKEKYKAMQEKGILHVKTHFEIERMYKEYLDLYKTVLKEKTTSSLKQQTKD